MPRRNPKHHTVRSLQEVRNSMADNLADLDAAIQTMIRSGLQSLLIQQGHVEMMRGLYGATIFIASIRNSLRDAQEERGDFTERPGEVDGDEPKRRRTPGAPPATAKRPRK